MSQNPCYDIDDIDDIDDICDIARKPVFAIAIAAIAANPSRIFLETNNKLNSIAN